MDKKHDKKEKSCRELTKPVIPKKAFSREIDKILEDSGFADVNFDEEAVGALRVAAEDFMKKFFKSTAISAANARRTVVKSDDVAAVKKHLEIIDKNSKNQ